MRGILCLVTYLFSRRRHFKHIARRWYSVRSRERYTVKVCAADAGMGGGSGISLGGVECVSADAGEPFRLRQHGVFSPDGQLVASGSCDSTAQLWDPPGGHAGWLFDQRQHGDVLARRPPSLQCLNSQMIEFLRLQISTEYLQKGLWQAVVAVSYASATNVSKQSLSGLATF